MHAVADFVGAIANQTEITPNFADGVAEMRVLTAALESAETGRRMSIE